MKHLYILLALILSFSAQGQILPDLKHDEAVEDSVLDEHENLQLPLSDSMQLNHLEEKAKSQFDGTLRSNLPPPLGPYSAMFEQPSGKTDSMILHKVKSILEKKVNSQLPIPDSTLLKRLSNKVKGIAKDSLRSISEPFMGSEVVKQLSNQKLDSTIVDHAKSIVKKAAKDSLDNYEDVPDIKLDSTTSGQIKAEAKQRIKTTLNEEGIEVPEVTIDSTLDDQIKTKAKAALEKETETDIPEITIDSTTATQLKKEVVRRAENTVKGREEFKSLEGLKKSPEIDEFKGQRDKLEQKQTELAQATAKQEIKEKLASHARGYITKHAKKIQEVQSKIGKLKKKYSTMPNSNDLSSAVKRRSLKGEPLWKRLVLGGNFNIGRTSPFSLDLSPVVGYKANKVFEVGATVVYRTQINADKKGISIRDGNVYGYGLFASHLVFGSFFGYLEGERITAANPNPENRQREWKELLLAGIGKKFNVSKWLEMQTMVLVNVLHDNGDGLYNSPVMFKTALRLR